MAVLCKRTAAITRGFVSDGFKSLWGLLKTRTLMERTLMERATPYEAIQRRCHTERKSRGGEGGAGGRAAGFALTPQECTSKFEILACA